MNEVDIVIASGFLIWIVGGSLVYFLVKRSMKSEIIEPNHEDNE